MKEDLESYCSENWMRREGNAERKEDGVDVLGSQAEAIPGGGPSAGPCSPTIPFLELGPSS
jgi:hypothetical protein